MQSYEDIQLYGNNYGYKATQLYGYRANGYGSKATRPKAMRLYGKAVKLDGYIVIWT